MRRLSLVGALVALAALVTAALATAAQAETFPSHPISLMVGFPPGGPTDTLARIMGEAIGKILGPNAERGHFRREGWIISHRTLCTAEESI